jgi:hypothetical protein
MAIPTPNHPPTPVATGTDVTIDGPSDLGAKIVKHLAEKHSPSEEELWKLDASKLKIMRSEKRSSLPEDLKFVWGATFVSWQVTKLGFDVEHTLAFLSFLSFLHASSVILSHCSLSLSFLASMLFLLRHASPIDRPHAHHPPRSGKRMARTGNQAVRTVGIGSRQCLSALCACVSSLFCTSQLDRG